MSNRLKQESSPYLLQHGDNPVDWYPWCEEAFEKAKQENKPIFLSVGYSTCHWCHVMAHESFENEEIAEILNQYFVSIKVDREERPDIDSVYMSVCQALTGSGGWPMSIFMTPEQKPFFAGTYFPPQARYGSPGFQDLLLAIKEHWQKDRSELLQSAEQVLNYINLEEYSRKSNKDISRKDEAQIGKLPIQAAKSLIHSFDRGCGGFGSAPKFPTPHNLIFLMLYSKLNGENMFYPVEKTLEQMRRGGIFDHIGYGFSRYSTDPYFLVPHFEKMLYDNALLIIAYAAAYKVSGNQMFLNTAEQTAEYVLNEMTGPSGEFYSAQDADSEGEEGKYYVWEYEEVCRILGEEKGQQFCGYYGITEQGNFEGKNIPNLLNGNDITDKFDEERKVLYAHRRGRAVLHLDDKILTSWNALMICAMSVLCRVTGRQCYLLAAEKTYEFMEENLMEGDILYVSCREGVRLTKGFLDEYAYGTAACLTLYEVTGKEKYLSRAERICSQARRQFEDTENGGYFLYGTENSSLITKPKETYDGAMPSGNSMMAYALVRLWQLTEKEEYKQAAESQISFMAAAAEDYPAGYCMYLTAFLMYENPPQKITAVLSAGDSKEKIRKKLPLYADITILEKETEEYKLLNGKTTYYVCKDFMCLPPTNESGE